MNRIRKTKWIASFDMGDLIAFILRNGILISIALILIALIIERLDTSRVNIIGHLQGTNVMQFLLADFQKLHDIGDMPYLLVHLSVAVLLMTPYVRVCAFIFYFLFVERSWPHAILSGCVAAFLSYSLLLG